VLEQYKLGEVYNVTMTANGLEGEAWFDYKLTKQKAPDILTKLKKNEPIEISTGLVTNEVAAPANSKFNGVSYSYIAKDFQPDHLAVLMEAKGACSNKDGCGINVNAAKDGETEDTETKDIGDGELSHEALRCMLSEALQSKFTQSEPWAYIFEVYDTSFIYEQGGDLYKLDYSKTDTGVSLLDSAPVEVVREVSYSPVTTNQESDMAKKELIDDLVTNGCGCWTEEDRKTLEGMSEVRLTSLVANSKETRQLQLTVNAANKVGKFDAKAKKFVVNETDPETTEDVTDGSADEEEKPAKKVTANSKGKETTVNEWLDDPSVPKPVKSAFKTAMKLEKQEIARLAKTLTANIKDEDLREEKLAKFMKKDLETLQEMVELMPTVNSQDEDEDNEPSFFGAALAVNTRRQQKSDPDDVLDTPTIDWSRTKSA